jgi:hypothetical protein
MMNSRNKKQHDFQPKRGFWIMEVTIAIAVIGIGVVAVVGSQQASHIQSVVSDRLATGMRLAIEIRELSLMLPAYDPVTGNTTWGSEPGELIPVDLDDLDDLDGVTFDGPIDATRTEIIGMNGWSQQIIVQCVNPFDVLEVVADGASDIIQMEAVIYFEGEVVMRLSWFSPR